LRQITAYRELTDLFDFFAKFNIVSLSAESVDLFNGFRKLGSRSKGPGVAIPARDRLASP
jgi:hypothetical protein